MNSEIRQLQPQEIWNKFADLNAVPRPSKKEERVIAFMKKFGNDLGLETVEDAVGNVIIKKTGISWYGRSEDRSHAISFRYGASEEFRHKF